MIPEPAIKLSPSRGQVEVLGLLMIAHCINSHHISSNDLYDDLREMVEMRLCHVKVSPSGVQWWISGRLLREWCPYMKICQTWHRVHADCEVLEKRIMLEKDNQRLSELAQALSNGYDLMQYLVMECGEGLALNWNRWKYEDMRVS